MKFLGCSFRAVATMLLLSGIAAAPQAAAQQVWPNKPIRLIVPFPPGGGTDAFARPLAKVLSQQLGQPLIVDNRGGAGGTLGAELAAKSPTDGYTFLLGAVHHAIATSMYPKLGYELQKDLAPVTVVAYVPNVVVINPQRMDKKPTPLARFRRRFRPTRESTTTHRLATALDTTWLTLPRFHVHQILGNFLMNGERDGQEGSGTEPAVHRRVPAGGSEAGGVAGRSSCGQAAGYSAVDDHELGPAQPCWQLGGGASAGRGGEAAGIGA